MRRALFDILEDSSRLAFDDILTRILMSIVLGFVIYISYRLSHEGTIYSKKFNVSLVTLTVLTGTVITVIGNNIALSLGMVGALSIVRFRTAIKDSRDTAYIFWCIVAGICCGIGDYLAGSVGSAAVFVVLFFLGRVRNDNRILLIIRAARNNERKIESAVFNFFNKRANLRVKNTTETSVELIYELTKSMVDKTATMDKGIVEVIYDIGSIEYVNMVTQNDEISG